MEKRERRGGCDGVCTRRPKSWRVLSALGVVGVEKSEEEKRKIWGCEEAARGRGWALFLELRLFRSWRGKTGALTTSKQSRTQGKFCSAKRRIKTPGLTGWQAQPAPRNGNGSPKGGTKGGGWREGGGWRRGRMGKHDERRERNMTWKRRMDIGDGRIDRALQPLKGEERGKAGCRWSQATARMGRMEWHGMAWLGDKRRELDAWLAQTTTPEVSLAAGNGLDGLCDAGRPGVASGGCMTRKASPDAVTMYSAETEERWKPGARKGNAMVRDAKGERDPGGQGGQSDSVVSRGSNRGSLLSSAISGTRLQNRAAQVLSGFLAPPKHRAVRAWLLRCDRDS